jgi:hypothetical protein
MKERRICDREGANKASLESLAWFMGPRKAKGVRKVKSLHLGLSARYADGFSKVYPLQYALLCAWDYDTWIEYPQNGKFPELTIHPVMA